VCADQRCVIVRFHRACVAVGPDVLGARGVGEDDDVVDAADPDAVVSMRWRCAACKTLDPVKCVCDGAGAPADADMIQCSSALVPACAEWYHVSCVGIGEDDDKTGEWFCPACTPAAAAAAPDAGDA